MAENARMNFMPTLPNRRNILAHYERIFFAIFGMFRVGVTFGTLVTFGTVTTVKLFNALSLIPGEFRYIL